MGAAAADCLARAVLVGVLAAESVAGIPTYRDMLPGAFGDATATWRRTPVAWMMPGRRWKASSGHDVGG